MKVTYDSNNSRGRWWLKDEDWLALEKAGWSVKWYRDATEDSGFYKKGRFLGALASEASREAPSVDVAIAEFEAITGQDASSAGCKCCGQPHNFYAWDQS